MQTGHDMIEAGRTADIHKMAIVTGATSVFMHDLCSDMAMLQRITGDTDMAGIAKACAARLVHGEKYRELELIVDSVIEHEDGMPEIENRPLLAEILACYSGVARAERTGQASEYRRTFLVPAIVADAMETDVPEGDEAVAFLNSINQYHSAWDCYQPSTPFQIIVRDAINGIPI